MIIVNEFESGWMRIRDFLNYENISPYDETRNEKIRAKKIAKIINEVGFLATHVLGIVIIEFPDRDSIEGEDPFPRKARQLLNGNTRRWMWMNGMIPRPDKINYTVIKLDENDPWGHADKLYRSIDSVDSYDRKGDLCTGVYRKLGLNFTNDKLEKGSVFTFLGWAAGRGTHRHPGITDHEDYKQTIKMFSDALVELDSMGAITKWTKAQVSLLVFFTMLIHKYQRDEQMYEGKIKPFIMKIAGNDHHSAGKLAVDHICREWHNEGGTIFEHQKGRRTKISNAVTIRQQLRFLHFFFNDYMTPARNAGGKTRATYPAAQRNHTDESFYYKFWEGFTQYDSI